MSAVASAIPKQFAHMPNYKWLATATVILGMMGAVMSSTMLNVAIPNIMGSFGIGQDEAHWMSTATLAAMPIMMLMNGWFVTNFGSRATYVGACVVFCVASAIGQLMPDYYGLVVIRAIQGGCTGLLQPLTMTVIFPLFPVEERGKAMGIYGMGFIVGPAMGPTVGGLIVDHWHWQDVFGASIPLMVLAGVMGSALLPGRNPKAKRTKLNWTSLLLITVASACFLTGLSNGPRFGWASANVFTLFLIAACCLATFISVELTTDRPLLQMRLFRIRTFTVSVLVGFVFGAGMFGSMYVLPIFAQTVLGYTAFKAGLLLMISGLLMVPIFPLGGALAQTPRSGIPISAGMFLFGVSSVVLAGADTYVTFLFVAFWATVGRIGLSIALPALQTGAMRELPPDLLPFGAGTLNFVRMTGAAAGTNVLAIMLDHRHAIHADYLAATQVESNVTTGMVIDQVSRLLSAGGLSDHEQAPLALSYLGKMVSGQANALAFQDAFVMLAVCFAIASIGALALARRPTSRMVPPRPSTKTI